MIEYEILEDRVLVIEEGKGPDGDILITEISLEEYYELLNE